MGHRGGKGAVAPGRTLAAQSQGWAPRMLPPCCQPCRWLLAMPGEDRRKVLLGLDAKGGFGAGRWDLFGWGMKVAAVGWHDALRSRGSTVAGVPPHQRGGAWRCLSVRQQVPAHGQGGESWCLRGCRGWAAAAGWRVASPRPRYSLAAGLPREMALAQRCSAAGQLGPAQRGGRIQAAGSAAPPGVPLCSPLLPSFPPSACRSLPAPPPRAHGRLRSGWRYGSLSKPIRRN